MTEDAVPVEQSFALGAEAIATPLAEPQIPALISGAEQEAEAPLLIPEQDQVNGPLPRTEDAVPVEQRFALGAVLATTLLALPQIPALISGAEQLAEAAPLIPAQDQVNGSLPRTEDAVPMEQRFAF